MRGRIPYVMIVGYISPTFIKILVDHAISQTRPYFFLNEHADYKRGVPWALEAEMIKYGRVR